MTAPVMVKAMVIVKVSMKVKDIGHWSSAAPLIITMRCKIHCLSNRAKLGRVALHFIACLTSAYGLSLMVVRDVVEYRL